MYVYTARIFFTEEWALINRMRKLKQITILPPPLYDRFSHLVSSVATIVRQNIAGEQDINKAIKCQLLIKRGKYVNLRRRYDGHQFDQVPN